MLEVGNVYIIKYIYNIINLIYFSALAILAEDSDDDDLEAIKANIKKWLKSCIKNKQ